jgi:hypothetical protein
MKNSCGFVINNRIPLTKKRNEKRGREGTRGARNEQRQILQYLYQWGLVCRGNDGDLRVFEEVGHGFLLFSYALLLPHACFCLPHSPVALLLSPSFGFEENLHFTCMLASDYEK